jgi:hypothetical protein
MRLLEFGDKENASSFLLELERGRQWTKKTLDRENQVPHTSAAIIFAENEGL